MKRILFVVKRRVGGSLAVKLIESELFVEHRHIDPDWEIKSNLD